MRSLMIFIVAACLSIVSAKINLADDVGFFTSDCSAGELKFLTMKLFADTGAHIVAAPQVAKELKREIPEDKITMGSHLGRYSLDGMDVTAIKGKHIGPIFRGDA